MHFRDMENSVHATSVYWGTELVSDRFFNDFPPSYDEIDSAINFTEEVLSEIQHFFDGKSILYSKDPMARVIVRLAFNNSIEGELIGMSQVEMEHVFNRLANIIKGLPSTQDVLPNHNEFAAYLLILREVMHHLHFDMLLVREF